MKTVLLFIDLDSAADQSTPAPQPVPLCQLDSVRHRAGVALRNWSDLERRRNERDGAAAGGLWLIPSLWICFERRLQTCQASFHPARIEYLPKPISDVRGGE
jgi:hypothetical protein